MTHPDLDLSAHTGREYDKGRSRSWQAAWFLAQHLLFGRWWLPARLRVLLLRGFGATVGKNVYIRHGVRVHWPWRLTLGDNCWVGEGVWLLNLAPVSVGVNVCLSQEALILAASHDPRSTTFEHRNRPITIGDGAWICARAIVLGGVTVDAHSIVPAGQVVRPHAGLTDRKVDAWEKE